MRRIFAVISIVGIIALPTAASAHPPEQESSWASGAGRQQAEQGGGSPTLQPTPTPRYVALRPVFAGSDRNLAV